MASGSPRRQELLNSVRIPFKVIPPQIDEDQIQAESVEERVKKIALKKIEMVCSSLTKESPRWILGVDTLIELGGKALGKPGSIEEAEIILRSLSGKVHRVYTGIGLLPRKGESVDLRSVRTDVKFTQLCEEEIEYYLMTGEWSGVTGAYRIQERGAFFIEWIKGSYSNVVGLPISTFYGMLKDNKCPLY